MIEYKKTDEWQPQCWTCTILLKGYVSLAITVLFTKLNDFTNTYNG